MTESRFVIDDRDTPRFRVHRSAMVEPGILEEERRHDLRPVVAVRRPRERDPATRTTSAPAPSAAARSS